MTGTRDFLLRFTTAVLFLVIGTAWSGELKTSYFTATKPGAWSHYLLTSSDGTKSSYVYERQADNDGRTVIEVRIKVLEGEGKDSRVKNTHIQSPSFDLDRDGLSYIKFTEEMSLNYNGNDMPVDEATLAVVKDSSKDFRGAVTFEATEKIGDRTCDRYGYSAKTGGPQPTVETGQLWVDPAVPFAIVKQAAKVSGDDGTKIAEFEMQLQDTGLNQPGAGTAIVPPPPVAENVTVPSRISLSSAFKAGLVGMDIEAIPGSAGRNLRLTLVNTTDGELTVTIPAGDSDFAVASPVTTLRITLPKAASVVLPANDKAAPLPVTQRGKRGIVEGKCTLSIFEGNPLFSGSATMDSLPE